MIYPFIYWATIRALDDDGQLKKCSGCTFAESFTEAMNNIENFYGEDLISVRLEPLEEGNLLEFHNPKEADEIVQNW